MRGYELENYYTARIRELLAQNKNLWPQFVKNLLSAPTVDLVSLAIIIEFMWLYENPDFYYGEMGMETGLSYSKFILLKENQGLLFLCDNSYNHGSDYVPFEISVNEAKVKIRLLKDLEPFGRQGLNINLTSPPTIEYNGYLGKSLWKVEGETLKLVSQKLVQEKFPPDWLVGEWHMTSHRGWRDAETDLQAQKILIKKEGPTLLVQAISSRKNFPENKEKSGKIILEVSAPIEQKKTQTDEINFVSHYKDSTDNYRDSKMIFRRLGDDMLRIESEDEYGNYFTGDYERIVQ